MAESLDFYVNMLAGKMSGLSAVEALKSLDSSAASATEKIRALESSYAKAKDEIAKTKTPPALAKMEAELAAVSKAKSRAFASGDVVGLEKASLQKEALEKKVAAAREKAAEKAAKQEEKAAAIGEKLKAAQQAQASSANLLSAKRALLVKGLDEQVSGLNRILSSAQQAGGPVGSLASRLQGLGKGGVVGVAVAVAVALAALAAAAVVATAALATYAIRASDAARSSRLLTEAALGTGSAAWELETVIDQMGNIAPGMAAKLREVGRSLADVHIQGRDAQRVLNTFGIVAQARGEQAAGAIKNIAETSRMAQRFIIGARDRFGEFASLKGTGIKAADIYAALAKSMRTSIPEAQRAVIAGLVPFKKGLEALELAAQTKLGGVVAKQLLSLSSQAEKLKENIGKIFAGANIEKFLEGLKTVTDLFDTNTVTGYVLREVVTAAFTKISEVAAKVFPYVRAAIQGVVAGIIITATSVKQLYRQFQETFGGAKTNIDGVMLAFKVGVGLVGLFVGSIVALTAAIAFLGVVAVVALAPIWVPIAIGVALMLLAVKAATALGEALSSIWDSVASIDLGKAAENIMNSLIKGIKNKIADVKRAISEVGSALLGAFDSKMEIASPSKAMTRRANFVVDPLEDVPEKRAGDVRRAIGGLGNLDKPQRIEQGGASSAGGAPTFSFSNCNFGTSKEDVIAAMNEWWAGRMLAEANGYAMGAS